MLTVERIGKSFGGVRALQDVSFTVPERSIFGIMGANGAGKTTLFAIIAGNLAPSSGAVRLGDLRLTGLPPHRVAAAGVARTFQIVRPFRGLSVQENVETALRFGARDRPAAAPADAAGILGLTGLDGAAGRPAGALTLAQQKRLEVARALATGPRLLMLDEVMAGLTPAEVQDTIAMVRRIRADMGVTVMIIEHVMGALMALSDHVVVLDHGETIAAGPPAQVADDPAVRSAYLGRRH
ncbi:MAG: ABC transporter ATP-binding protein [Rhodospirillaceae bacterium]|nr:ABC transporter ATP-binding protein [Rhodospirillaceae bacterium]MYB13071.1 ABC transporter ATP-binding protein [Rhodospirillaceae bacterium]MYI50428.1 ABC transporter ATP-binding protein [Rhodospirillaceae bacterium]